MNCDRCFGEVLFRQKLCRSSVRMIREEACRLLPDQAVTLGQVTTGIRPGQLTARHLIVQEEVPSTPRLRLDLDRRPSKG